MPPWQVSVGAEYGFDLGKTAAYVRGDVTYSSNFQNGPGPGLGGYAPDTYLLPSVTRGDALIRAKPDAYELSFAGLRTEIGSVKRWLATLEQR